MLGERIRRRACAHAKGRETINIAPICVILNQGPVVKDNVTDILATEAAPMNISLQAGHQLMRDQGGRERTKGRAEEAGERGSQRP
eukprot:4002615-Heterocapsa_arctica.AAC.1